MNPAGLLGQRDDSPEVRRFLLSLGPIEESWEEPEHDMAVPSAGIQVMSEDGIIYAVTLYRTYPGKLPLGLRLGMTRPEVRSLLGEPDFAREAGDMQLLGTVGPRIGPGDRYDGEQFSTALDYDEATLHISFIQLLLARRDWPR